VPIVAKDFVTAFVAVDVITAGVRMAVDLASQLLMNKELCMLLFS
jgi:hypothetical protein